MGVTINIIKPSEYEHLVAVFAHYGLSIELDSKYDSITFLDIYTDLTRPFFHKIGCLMRSNKDTAWSINIRENDPNKETLIETLSSELMRDDFNVEISIIQSVVLNNDSTTR